MDQVSRRHLSSRDMGHTSAERILRRGSRICLVVVIAVAALCFFWPNGTVIRRILLNIWLWATPTPRLRELIGPEDVEQFMNMLVFVPVIGLMVLAFPRVRWWVWLLVSAACACGIELSQLLFLPGLRQFDPVDALFNTLGGVLGTLLALSVRRTVRRRAERRRTRPPESVSSPAVREDMPRTRS